MVKPTDKFDHASITSIRGTKGDDTIIPTEAEYGEDINNNFRIRSSDGNDYISMENVGGVQNLVDAGTGDDTIVDSRYYDSIKAGTGNDIIWHTGGNDILQGNAGNDIINVDLYKALNAPTPPQDPGGPFHTYIDGGTESDKVVFHMTNEQITGGYKDAISTAFESWKNAGSTDALDLNESTASLEKPVNIFLNSDLENLQIVDPNGDTIYIYQAEDANNPIDV